MNPAEARAFLREVVRPAVHPQRVPLIVTARHLPGEPLEPAVATALEFEPFAVGDRWGGMWGTTWFRCQAGVPESWPAVVALVHLGGAETVGFSAEGLVYDRDLRPVQGLHHEHRSYPIAAGSSPVDFWIEAAANPIPQWELKDWPRMEPDYAGSRLYVLQQAELAMVDGAARELAADFDIAVQIAEWIEPRRDEALASLADAMAIIAGGRPDSTGAARAALSSLLSRRNSSETHTVVATGHAHIDTAWLWPIRETRRKCARTFANQLRLLERYSEHHFACSQAVQYQWIKEDHPDLYAQIKAMVADGRWEPVGGAWVEADSNVPSGESLARQLIHGKRFFAEEFGVESHEMWIPDVFGYSAALPQIALLAGVDALVTQKMSWNDTNTFPHTSFWWEGHDGSRILAHFPPAATYNGNVSVPELMGDARNFLDGDRSSVTLYPFGYGDGGGGPAAHQLDAARRLADVEGLPRVQVGAVADFLTSLRASGESLATWAGELYLEAHRATATTHADIKKANRRNEEALRQAELWSVAAGVDANEHLDALWKLLLVNQFHDIIPGSSIAWVYRDAAADHARIATAAAAVIDSALAAMGAGGRAVLNPSSWDRTEVVSGRVVTVPGCGWAPLEGPPPTAVSAGDGWLDNGFLRVTYDQSGAITSVWDHAAGREVLAPGERANVLQIHDDHPRAFDAWDVDREYLESRTDIPGRVDPALVHDRPHRVGVRISHRFGASSVEQAMWLTAGSRRIEFDVSAEWHEDHKFLKVAFPVDIRSSRATFEIQHGHIERPTHTNTSWDEARFEVCAHRWADLSEQGYGVALLNDCKYGYDVRGHTLRLSLLRAPGYPDPDADRGHHTFRYALYPHQGGPVEGRVVEEAEAFNLPLIVREPGPAGSGRLIDVDRPGVSIEAVKAADDGHGVIVRLCEVHGLRRPARVRLNRPFSNVTRTDLLERPLGDVDLADGTATLALRPFELVTLRFT
jgi:alpha-mannosidase